MGKPTKYNNWWLITFILLGFINLNSIGQYSNIAFDKITTKDGLSQSTVRSIIEDSEGYLWIGSENGLNKYDGYEFTIFQYDNKDTTSISGNRINCLAEDFDGNIWVGTGSRGLNKFDKRKNNFTRFLHVENNANSLGSNAVSSITINREGNVWVGTLGGGLNVIKKGSNNIITYTTNNSKIGSNFISSVQVDKNGIIWMANNSGLLISFNSKTGNFKNYYYDKNYVGQVTSAIYGKLFIDSKNEKWIGTENGIYIFNTVNQRFRHVKKGKENQSLNSNAITGVVEFTPNIYWIATNHGGLNIYDSKTGKFAYFTHNFYDFKSISNNQIYCIYKDKSSVYWIGTFNGGINYFNKAKTEFNKYYAGSVHNKSLNFPSVLTFYEDYNKDIWIGTDGGGINVLNPKNETFSYITFNSDNENSISNNIITYVYGDKSNTIWVGTYLAGLNRYNRKTNSFTNYLNNPADPNTLSHNIIWGLHEDINNNLWIATDDGLNLFDRKNLTFTSDYYSEKDNIQLVDNTIYKVLEDKKGNIWFGTPTGGLSMINPKTNKIFTYLNNPQDSNSLINDWINDMYEDDEGYLWIATNLGLSQLNTRDFTFVNYTKKDGLPGNTIKSIVEDNSGNLWLGTNNGLSRFNIKNKNFKNYTYEDGLGSNEFNLRAAYKSSDGKLYFGSPTGFTSFYADSLTERPNNLDIVFTGFSLFNKEVKIDSESKTLSKHINYLDEISLLHKQSVFTIKYAAIEKVKAHNIKFAYKLEGFDKEWNFVNKERKATYTNLDAGEYLFKVKATIDVNDWNVKERNLKIVIVPPIWQTKGFFALTAIITLLLIYLIFKLRIRKLKHDKKILELKVKERTKTIEAQKDEVAAQKDNIEIQKNQLQKLNATKDRFFSIIAHDLRSPVSNLFSLSELIYQQQDTIDHEKRTKLIKHLRTASKNVFNLLENLLQWSTSKLNNDTFNPEIFTLTEVICPTILLVSESANKKDINLEYSIPDNAFVLADKNMITTIIRNLLSNAIKFTNPLGKISLDTKIEENKVVISINDTGVGMNETIVKNLFKIDKTNSTKGTMGESGTGLGLIICKDFVEKHNSKLFVESKESEGTKFSFKIPLA